MKIDSEQYPTLVNNDQQVGVDLPDLAGGIDHDDVIAWRTIPAQKRAELNQMRIDQYLVDWETLRNTPAFKNKGLPLISFHMPKTGGTTLHGLMAKNYTPGILLKVHRPEVMENPSAIFRKGELRKVLVGHYDMSTIIYQAIRRPFIHITMLRDPIERIISFYNYYCTRPKNAQREKAVSQGFETFSENSLAKLSNGQVLRLAGCSSLQLDNKHKQIGREMVNIAMENLARRFSCFGLQERYPEFLLMARQLLGWSDIFHCRRKVSQRRIRRDEIDQATLNRIQERNKYDIELYEFARQLFQERCQQLGITQERVERFEQANKQ